MLAMIWGEDRGPQEITRAYYCVLSARACSRLRPHAPKLGGRLTRMGEAHNDMPDSTYIRGSTQPPSFAQEAHKPHAGPQDLQRVPALGDAAALQRASCTSHIATCQLLVFRGPALAPEAPPRICPTAHTARCSPESCRSAHRSPFSSRSVERGAWLPCRCCTLRTNGAQFRFPACSSTQHHPRTNDSLEMRPCGICPVACRRGRRRMQTSCDDWPWVLRRASLSTRP